MRRARMTAISRALIVALALAAAPHAVADAEPVPERDKRAEVAARMKQLRGEILRSQVGLDAHKAAAVEKVLEGFAPERTKLYTELRAQQDKLAELLRADSDDQAAFSRAVQAVRSARSKIHTLKQREFAEISRYMTPKQQAKFLDAVRRTRAKLREKLSEYPERAR